MWWPETGLNRRRRPFQGLNNLYLQLLRRLRGSPKYGEIRVKRVNHGWAMTGGDLLRCAAICAAPAPRRAPPPPSRLQPTSRCRRLYGRAAPRISAWGEEGFSSCIVHPCRRAVATTPPVCPAASVRLRPAMLPSPVTRGLGHWSSTFRGHLCLYFRYGPTTRSPSLRWLCRWTPRVQLPSPWPSKLRGC
jgi:hypothetical protein